MSQYGAQGAALGGLSTAQILAFYYPTTHLASVPIAPVRVGLTSLGRGPVTIAPIAGLAVSAGGGSPITLPAGPAGWQVRVATGGVTLWQLAASGTAAAATAVGLTGTLPGALTFTAPGGVPVTRPDGGRTLYTGSISTRPAGGGLLTVNTTTMDDYLEGVVPAEMPAGWPAAALGAQAVAARTYADRAGNGAYQVCDTSACQVYRGAAALTVDGTVSWADPAASTAAVTATSGQVLLTTGGIPATTMYSASDGGQTTADPGVSYLIAQPDPYDQVNNPTYQWSAAMPAATLAARFGLTQVDQVTVLSRDGAGQWGGRVLQVQLDGQDGAGSPASVVVSGAQFAAADSWPADPAGLRSTYFTITGAAASSGTAPAGGATAASGNPMAAGPGLQLAIGSTGPLVMEVQRVVGAAVDGDFGPLTEQAVGNWQAAHGIAVTGVVSYPLWKAMGLPVQAAASPVPAPADPATAFLTALGTHLLGGPLPDAATLLPGLRAGTLTRAAAVAIAMGLSPSRAAQINTAYLAVLGRPADPSGLATFTALLDRGLPDEQMRALLAGSGEFYARAGATPLGFVAAIYQRLLGRSPDPGGLAAWSALTAKGGDRAAIAATFLRSREAAERTVQAAYQMVLGRAADPGGLAAWTGYLTHGGSSNGLYPQLYASAEFLAHAGG